VEIPSAKPTIKSTETQSPQLWQQRNGSGSTEEV